MIPPSSSATLLALSYVGNAVELKPTICAKRLLNWTAICAAPVGSKLGHRTVCYVHILKAAQTVQAAHTTRTWYAKHHCIHPTSDSAMYTFLRMNRKLLCICFVIVCMKTTMQVH